MSALSARTESARFHADTEVEVIEMPTGSKGERRPADAIARAVKVMRIFTGEEREDYGDAPKRTKLLRS